MRKVIKNSNGEIINIGEWEYAPTSVDIDGTEVWFVGNDYPDGAYEDLADIVEGWDGGLYESSNPARLGPPKTSEQKRIDKLEELIEQLLASQNNK